MTDRLPGTGDIHLDLVIGNFSAELLQRAAAIRDISSGSDSRRFFRFSLRRRCWLARAAAFANLDFINLILAVVAREILIANSLLGLLEFVLEILPSLIGRIKQLLVVFLKYEFKFLYNLFQFFAVFLTVPLCAKT